MSWKPKSSFPMPWGLTRLRHFKRSGQEAGERCLGTGRLSSSWILKPAVSGVEGDLCVCVVSCD